MAEVYVAKAKGIGGFEKLVAIKVIHPRFSEDDHFVTMLVEEAKISVQLSHVNIAQTFDLGCIDDTYYIAMEFIEGADAYRVTHRAKDRKLAIPIDICIYIASEICNGLGYAHRKRDPEGRSMGIVHRDISPQNVLMSFAGEVKLVDFGIAKAALRGGQTEVGVIKGKYYYMSPEQAWGDPVDARSDIFSAGIVLHELLTGDMVYHENNVPALLDKVRKAEIESPRALRPDVSPQLEAVLMKALQKEPEDRYESAHAFGQALTEQLYKGNPTFTASRLSQLMATLFPDDVRRHSQIIELPEAEEAHEPPEPSAELPVMSKDEFLPSREASVVFDLAEEEGEDATRNDILPFRKGNRATRQIDAPAEPKGDGPTSPDRFAGFGVAAPEEWEEETHLKERGEWDESTLVDEDGDAFMAAHGAIKALRDDEPEELQGESTVATPNPLAYLSTRVADSSQIHPPGGVHDRTAMGAPAFDDGEDDDDEPQRTAVAASAFESEPPDKTAIGASAFPDSEPPPPPPAPAAFPRPSGVKPRSVPPPPGRLPPRKIPPPARMPRPRPPEDVSPTLDEMAPRTSAAPEGAPRHLPDGAPEELPAEPTVALQESTATGPRSAPLSTTSQGGIRLGPEADRFFAPSSTGEADALPAPGQPQHFDPFGGVPVQGTGAGQRPLDDPFQRPPSDADPFAAQHRSEELPADPSAQLGKPRPIRWILAFVAFALLVAGVAGLGAYIASRPDPTSLTLITTPEGATVRLDGEELPHRTPVTLPELEPGREIELVLTHPGHEERSDSFPLRAGENRRVYHLNPIRVSLRISTEPAGAQVWVDGVLRGSAPLEISGLSEGDQLTLRANLLGRQVERGHTVGAERQQDVTLTLPTAGRETEE